MCIVVSTGEQEVCKARTSDLEYTECHGIYGVIRRSKYFLSTDPDGTNHACGPWIMTGMHATGIARY
jgi:hypothetical protein